MKPDIRRALREGLNRFSALSYQKGLSISLGLLLLAGAVDHLTGTDSSPLLLYLFPIALASWFLRAGDGGRAAALSGGAFFVINLIGRRYDMSVLAHGWDALSAFAVFWLAALILGKLRAHIDGQAAVARADILTGIANRRGFQESMEAEILRSRRWNAPLTLAIMDIDHFKTLNDTMGRPKGDQVLKQTATLLRDNLRATDALARMGGDEFAFILVGSAPPVVKKVVEKIHYGLRGMAMSHEWPVSFSIGVVTYLSPPASTDDMVTSAFELMREVKQERGSPARYKVVEAEKAPAREPVAGGTTIS